MISNGQELIHFYRTEMIGNGQELIHFYED